MPAPTKSTDFDSMYRSPVLHWAWTDPRIPNELKALITEAAPRRALELGCGLGRFSRHVAQHGVDVTGVDFSAVAIAKARARAAGDDARPAFRVGDVTHLDGLTDRFDVAFDVGCFHCLPPASQHAYASELARLVTHGGTHLIWALDRAPSGGSLSPRVVEQVFSSAFSLMRSQTSRRRLAASHWYWLRRADNSAAAHQDEGPEQVHG